jgi:hypothetical protein
MRSGTLSIKKTKVVSKEENGFAYFQNKFISIVNTFPKIS